MQVKNIVLLVLKSLGKFAAIDVGHHSAEIALELSIAVPKVMPSLQ